MNPEANLQHNNHHQPVKLHIAATSSIAHFPSVRRAQRRKNISLGVTFSQLFVITQLGMNWNAYRDNLRYSWQKSILSHFESPKEEVPRPERLPELGAVTSRSEDLTESLRLAIAPLDTRLIIPKIEQNVPIVSASSDNLLAQNWSALEKEIQKDLQEGVVHYPATANPGEPGNMVITGHSSYYPWDQGRYKTVFSLLEKMEEGDEFIVFEDQKEYRYRISSKEIVKATDVDVLDQEEGPERVTLITCWPTGTNYKRLVVVGERVMD